MSERRFIRVLTDTSDGKRLLLDHHYEIPYVGEAAVHASKFGDIVIVVTSSATGTVKRVITLLSTTGTLSVTLDKDDGNTEDASFLTGENIQVSGSTKAQVGSGGGYSVFQQQTAITSVDNPNYGAIVDRRGAVSTRFTEGSPTFDSFGKMQVSTDTIIAEYISKVDVQSHLWYDKSVGSSTLSHEPDHRGTLLSCTTTDGDEITRTSHLYHPYVLGMSQSVEMTLACGDAGKDGSYRLWGYGDDADGLFFNLNGTGFRVIIRSSSSGSVSENVVDQSDWNKDKLDGSNDQTFNISGHNLDVTRDIIYWVDFQWLGAGRIRFGVIIQGERIVVHEQHHSNVVGRAYMRSGDLPVRIQNKNTAVTTSTSELRYWGVVVKTGNSAPPTVGKTSRRSKPNESVGLSLPGGSAYKKRIFNHDDGRPLLSLRAKSTVNGIVNRTVSLPETLSVVNLSNNHVNVDVTRGLVLASPVWESFGTGSVCEIDFKGEIPTTSSGVVITNFSISPNSSRDIDLRETFTLRCNKVILSADGADQDLFQYSFVASSLVDKVIYTYSGVTLSFSTQTITRSSGNFTSDGFLVGQGLHIQDSVSNDGYYIISNVGTTTMLVEASQTFTIENTTDGITATAGITSNVVSGVTLAEYL